MIQVVRSAADTWSVTVVREMGEIGGERAVEYEVLGRVVIESGFYWAERAEWTSGAPTYKREGKGRLLLRAAVADL